MGVFINAMAFTLLELLKMSGLIIDMKLRLYNDMQYFIVDYFFLRQMKQLPK